ncbi:MAG: VTT domain-containing protein, partial [Gammaproteobacteria bacterium]|nr:VTT domain-containing protein [Gammaproteobacteria bacterium]
LAIVGIFLPGAVFIFGAGALVGTGSLPLWPTLAVVASGAIVGDGISFWLGRHFHQQIRTMWPLSRHPALLNRATDFFYHHGGKSVLLGRFIGPIRPVIPVVAGMLDMPTRRFILFNVGSALLWAPCYVIPGMVFSASLGLAAEVATRLAMLAGLLLTIIFVVIWLSHRLFKLLQPRAHFMIRRTLEWSKLHPKLGEVPAALLDPHHPEAKGLTLLALVLLLAGVLFLLILQAIGGNILLPNMDNYVYQTLQDLRTPWMDSLMTGVTLVGAPQVLSILFIALLAWLTWHRRWHASIHWVAAAAFALLLTYSLNLLIKMIPPLAAVTDVGNFSFPSPYATHSMIVYGFLAVLVAREQKAARRWISYAIVGTLIAMIAFSRLYLGAHLLSGVVAGLTLGLTWVALLGIAYQQHPSATLSARTLSVTAILVITIAGGWNIQQRLDDELAHYAPHHQTSEMEIAQWWQGQWQTLPRFRSDLRATHRHPLTVQYAGTLEQLQSTLKTRGWRAAPALTASSWMQWFGRDVDIKRLPVLPQVHEGRNESLLLVYPVPETQQLYALRLWSAPVSLQPDNNTLWLGNVATLGLKNIAGVANIPHTLKDFTHPLLQLQKDVKALPHRLQATEDITVTKSADMTLLLKTKQDF